MCLCNACVYTSPTPPEKHCSQSRPSITCFGDKLNSAMTYCFLCFEYKVWCGNIRFCSNKTLFPLLKFKRVLRRAEPPQQFFSLWKGNALLIGSLYSFYSATAPTFFSSLRKAFWELHLPQEQFLFNIFFFTTVNLFLFQ